MRPFVEGEQREGGHPALHDRKEGAEELWKELGVAIDALREHATGHPAYERSSLPGHRES